jgi:peptidyl-prolyl cis-trans isomerase D
MAVIGRIRKRVGLLIAFVGISMLLFILGDLVTSNKGIMNKSSDVVGVVNGEKIHYQEFERKVDHMIENYKANTKSENIDQNTTDMLREQAWNMAVNENTLGKEYTKLGVSCSPDELFDLVAGKNPHAQVKQAFTDPKTGIFDPQTVVRFLKDLPNRDEATQKQWNEFENAVRDERIAQKYKDIIKSGLYVTSLEAKNNFIESGKTLNLKYVVLNYNSIPDSSVKPEESELKTYYNAHANEYKQAETIRKIEYVTFDITPSADDRKEITDWAAKKKEEFEQASDNVSFVNQNSDTPFDSAYYPKSTLPLIDSSLFTASTGTVVGPFEDGGSIKISKLNAVKMVPDSVKARHILLKIEGNDTAAVMARADSLKNAIKKGSSFADLATKFSQDPGSAIKGGDLGWFLPGRMVKPFNDACFEGKKGDLPIVISQFGVHLIEILDKGKESKQVQIATLTRKVEPSQKTYDALYNKANQFAATASSGDAFDSAVVKQGLNKRTADNIRESDKNIPGLEQPRELIRWVYKAEKGEVSKAFTVGEKYVIAHLVSIKEKGIQPLEDVRPQVTAAVIRQKKADMLIEKFNKQAAGATTIDAVAQKMNTGVTDANNLTFLNTYIPAAGNEPRVVGTAFALKQGEISKPIKGESGVFIVMVSSVTEPAPAKDFEANRKQLLDQRKGRSEYEVFNALKEKANIEDNRGRFY